MPCPLDGHTAYKIGAAFTPMAGVVAISLKLPLDMAYASFKGEAPDCQGYRIRPSGRILVRLEVGQARLTAPHPTG